MISQAVQDYLKTIFKLQVRGPVSTTEIAKELKVSGASVTGMLKRLAGMAMVDYNSYKGVKLTEKGEKIALEIIRHHRLLELYLKEMLDFPLEKVHEEACRLEHYVSKEFVDKITELLGNPKFDPHGHPIPTKDGELNKSNEKSLVEIEVGKEVQISRLADDDSKMLAYLEDLNLVPTEMLKIIEKAPFNGPLTLKFNNQEIIIGNKVARNIFIRI